MKYRIIKWLTGGIIAVSMASCQPVSLLDQVPLTKPGRQFQERGAFGTDCGITSQVESGRISGGGSTGGSGSC